MKKISYLLEAAALWLAFMIFRVIGADNASDLGGWIGRTVGPRLAASRKARANLEKSLPGADHDAILRDMWDNLGRVIAEYPHLKHIFDRLDAEGTDNLDKIGRNNSYIAVGGHLANWELIPFYLNHSANSPINGIYREPNNPYAAKLLEQCRNVGQENTYIPKSQAGARAMIKTLQQGGRLGLLFDQKYNQGEPIDFFGRPAMTSVAVGQLSLKFNIPILPLQIIREGHKFRLIIHPPLDTTGKDEKTIMLELNRMLEGWIRERPGQWLWLHRRWDSKALQ